MKNDAVNMNRRLAEILGIPGDAISATLVMHAGEIPELTITRVIYRTGQLDPVSLNQRFRLVPINEKDAT